MRLRIAEINENAVAHVPGDEAIEPGDDFADRTVICADDLTQILGIEPSRELGRTDQIAEHHRQLPALSIDSRWCFTGRRRHHGGRHLGNERGNSVEQSPSMPYQRDAEILQILGGQSRQYRSVDLVVAERLFVLLQPETVEPCRYVHALLLPHGCVPLIYHTSDCLCA